MINKITNKFAERLKELRVEKEMSQRQLAKATGFSSAAIARWEADLQVPNIDTIIVLCQFFGCTADYLIGLED